MNPSTPLLHSTFRLSLYLLLSTAGLLLFSDSPLTAQTVSSVKGRVIDELKEPLIGVNVRLTDAAGQMITGATSDKDGHFALSTHRSGTFSLIFSYIGYQTVTKSLTLPLSENIGEIVLTSDSKLLDAIVVQGKALDMNIKGDTIVFNASAYRVGEGAMLEELIKRLPGAEIDENGAITINGKKIEKLMVEGREFFSGDPSMASKNLPAEAIDRLELLERESEQTRMTGFSDGQEETVLNLTFKKSHRQGFFGSAMAGYGTNNRFEGHSTNNSFLGDNRWTIVASTNNTNNRGMGEFDGQNEETRRRRGRGNQGITTSITVGGDVAQSFGKTTLDGNTRYGYSDNVLNRTTTTELMQPNDSNLFSKQEEEARTTKHGVNLETRIEVKPDDKTTLVIKPIANWGKGHLESLGSTTTTNSAGTRLNELSSRYSALFQNLRLGGDIDAARHLNDKGRVLGFQARVNYDAGEDDGSSYTTLEIAKESNGDKNEEERSYKLVDNTKQLFSALTLTWIEPLGRNYYLQAQVGWDRTERHTNHSLFTPDREGAFSLLSEQYSGKFRNLLQSYSGLVSFQKREETYDLTLGVSFTPNFMNTYSDRFEGGVYSTRHFGVAPNIRFTFKPSKQTTLRLRYHARTLLPDIRYMVPFSDPTNPLEIKEGSLKLEPSYTHALRGSFQHFGAESRMAIHIFFRAEYTLNDVASRVAVNQAGQRFITYENVSGTGMARLFGSFTMPIFSPFFSLSLAMANFYDRSIGFLQAQQNIANRFRIMPQGSLSYVRGPLYLRAGLMGGINHTANTLNVLTNSSVWDFGGKLDASYELPFGLKFETDITYRGNSGFSREYRRNEWLWNGALSYSFLKNKAATVRLKVYDILGSETGISRISDALNITDSRTNVLGRYAIIHFVYRFGSFSGKSSQTSFSPHGRREGGFR